MHSTNLDKHVPSEIGRTMRLERSAGPRTTLNEVHALSERTLKAIQRVAAGATDGAGPARSRRGTGP